MNLFGSRAPGAPQTDSDADADVAVVLSSRRDFTRPGRVSRLMSCWTTGCTFLRFPIGRSESEQPESRSNPRLLHDMKREGRPSKVWVDDDVQVAWNGPEVPSAISRHERHGGREMPANQEREKCPPRSTQPQEVSDN